MVRKKLLSITVILFLITTVFLFYSTMPPANSYIEKTLYFPHGSSVKQISLKLKEEGLIKNAYLFQLAVFLTGNYTKLKSGEYKLHNRMSFIQIINIISSGKVVIHEITIPEGFNIYQIASILKKENIIESEDEFIAVSKDQELLRSAGIEANSAEGYLFPDTYRFLKGMPITEIIAAMIRKHWEIWTPEIQKRAERLRLSHHDVVTLASIIEKETNLVDEMPFISSVFHNRLKRGIPLQSDPTVIYAIWDRFDGDLKREDLRVESPYNTYRRIGLPPGPICNPGKNAILAALYPANTQYLYFVSRNDGSHYFSSNIEDHSKAVYRYQISPWKGRKKD